MYDCHVHSVFSHDSECDIEKYMLLLKEKRVEAIGFAEHADYIPGEGGYQNFDYLNYKQKVKAYSDRGCNIYAGAEVSYLRQNEDAVLKELRNQQYDFVIYSTHRSYGYSLSSDRCVDSFKDTKLFRKLIKNYYLDINEGINVKDFDVVGHIGIYKRYLHKDYLLENGLDSFVWEMEDELAQKLSKCDKIVEVNTSGFFAPAKSPFPSEAFLKRYFDLGGRRVCLGSDAHSYERVGAGFKEAKKMLFKIGFEYLYLPWDKENPVKID